MNDFISFLNDAKTDEVIDLNNTKYLYHGIFIPFFADSSPIVSIIENGILTLKDQYKNGIISLEELQKHEIHEKGLLKFLKSIFNNGQLTKSNSRTNIVFFSPNRNLFNRVFDVTFVVRRESNYYYLENTQKGDYIRQSHIKEEKEIIKKTGENDYTEFVKIGSVLPSELIAIKINFDELIDHNSVEKRGVPIEEMPIRIINMANDIYDKLEEKNLNVPIINSSDGRVLNKKLFRQLKETFNYSEKHI